MNSIVKLIKLHLTQVLFVSNRPFLVRAKFSWGKFSICNIRELNEGKGTDHHICKSGNIWKIDNDKHPLVYNKIQLVSESMGDAAYESWIKSNDLINFTKDIESAIMLMHQNYKIKIEKEHQLFIKSIEKLEQTITYKPKKKC